jgi:hypothetical protein
MARERIKDFFRKYSWRKCQNENNRTTRIWYNGFWDLSVIKFIAQMFLIPFIMLWFLGFCRPPYICNALDWNYANTSRQRWSEIQYYINSWKIFSFFIRCRISLDKVGVLYLKLLENSSIKAALYCISNLLRIVCVPLVHHTHHGFSLTLFILSPGAIIAFVCH